MNCWAAAACLSLAVVEILPTVAASQAAPTDSAATAPRSAWRVIPALEARLTRDDNVFLLAPAKKTDMEALSAGEVASGRYTDMESASDVIPAVEAALEFRGRGAAGRRLAIIPEIRWEQYLSNTRRSNARLGLALEQDLPKDGRLRLRGRYTPEYFAKNYLHDVADQDSSRTIASAERRYRAGTYAESEAWVDWRVRLARRTKSRPVGAELELGAGYDARTYDEPFEGRDLAGPVFSALLDLDTGKRTAVALQYELDALGCDPSTELLLIDEAEFGLDFNGNLNATDTNVPARVSVDRSRTDHTITATLRVEASPKTAVKAFLGWRARSYSSDGAYDVGYRDRKDTRLELGGSVRWKLNSDADFSLGGEFAKQTTNRPGDPGSTGDEDDYRRVQLFAALTYRR